MDICAVGSSVVCRGVEANIPGGGGFFSPDAEIIAYICGVMKIVHTSDWHVGQKLYGYDRGDEHRAMARRVIDICVDERPDALVVAGDLFDNDHPSAADQRLMAETFATLHDELPGLPVIAVAGNHDSPSRHESHAAIYESIGVTMTGRLVDGAGYPDRFLVDVGTGVIAAIPYYIAATVSTAELLAEARRRAGDRPVVATGHATVMGCDLTGHDGATIGLLEAVTPERFGPEGSYDYLALGHIHRPQWVGTSGRVRYSGSPLQVSFDEAYGHSVSVVEIAARGAMPAVREIAVEQPRPAVSVPASGFVDLDEGIKMLAGLDDSLDAYVRLNVLTDGMLPASANEDAARAVAGKRCRFCLINARRVAAVAADRSKQSITVEELRMASPMEVARSYAASVGATLDEELFAEVMRELSTISEN